MQRYKTFIIFLIVLACWSFLFSAMKFFIWNDTHLIINSDLQQISGYLSLGSAFAYLIGGAVSLVFLKRYLLAFLALFVSFLLTLSYFYPLNSFIYFGVIVSSIGFLYGLWVVVKNIILSYEIQKTGLVDTKVNAIANVVFIIFIILGSILGNKIYEVYNHNGLFILIGILLFLFLVSFGLDYENVNLKTWAKSIITKKYILEKKENFKQAFSQFIPEIKYIGQNFLFIIVVSSILWTVTTIVSQQVIELSVEKFKVATSNAALIMLYSSVGVIIGNIVSSFLEKVRWTAFIVLNILSSVFILGFIFLTNSFFQAGIVAFLLGLVFGASSNLIDSYFLLKIGEKDKREYASATYGLIFSIVLFVFMFVFSYIYQNFGFNVSMIVLSAIVFFITVLFYFRKENV